MLGWAEDGAGTGTSGFRLLTVGFNEDALCELSLRLGESTQGSFLYCPSGWKTQRIELRTPKSFSCETAIDKLNSQLGINGNDDTSTPLTGRRSRSIGILFRTLWEY